jgi:hypothetical protein
MYQNWVGLAWAENVFISFYILWCFAYLFLCIFLVSSCWIWADRRIPHARDESVATRPVLPLFMRRISIAGSIFHSFLTSHSIQAVRILEIRCQVGWSDFIDIFSQVTCLKKIATVCLLWRSDRSWVTHLNPTWAVAEKSYWLTIGWGSTTQLQNVSCWYIVIML